MMDKPGPGLNLFPEKLEKSLQHMSMYFKAWNNS